MKLEQESFPLSFSLTELKKLIEELVKEKDWTDFKIKETRLEFTPFYYFSFDAFTESKEEGTVSETIHGTNAFDPINSRLNEEIALSMHGIQLTQEIDVPEEIQFTGHKTEINEEQAKKIVQIKVAEKLKLKKDNVLIHQLKKVLFPAWFVSVEVEETEYQLIFSGIDGRMLCEDTIPFRKKGLGELFQETLSDLSSPKGWADYSRSFFTGSPKEPKETEKTPSEKKQDTKFLSARNTGIIILIIILAFLILWAAGII